LHAVVKNIVAKKAFQERQVTSPKANMTVKKLVAVSAASKHGRHGQENQQSI
jgi:hypothetical protein